MSIGKEDFLRKMERFYTATFDLERNLEIEETVFDLYGHFNVDNTRYVLSKKATLWEANCQEHLFVSIAEQGSRSAASMLEEMDHLLHTRLEKDYVRGGEKYPPKNHMYSFLTVVIATEDGIAPQDADFVSHYAFNRSYLFQLRGYMETRLILVSLKDGQIVTNKAGKPLKKTYTALFR